MIEYLIVTGQLAGGVNVPAVSLGSYSAHALAGGSFLIRSEGASGSTPLVSAIDDGLGLYSVSADLWSSERRTEVGTALAAHGLSLPEEVTTDDALLLHLIGSRVYADQAETGRVLAGKAQARDAAIAFAAWAANVRRGAMDGLAAYARSVSAAHGTAFETLWSDPELAKKRDRWFSMGDDDLLIDVLRNPTDPVSAAILAQEDGEKRRTIREHVELAIMSAEQAIAARLSG